MSYNGWRNYPTWAINLWLNNDRELRNVLYEEATYLIADDHSDKKSAVDSLSDYIESLVSEMNPLYDESGMFSDILSDALAYVDYHSISELFVDRWFDEILESLVDDEDDE